ncbi:MAG: SLC13 family permease, partial [Synechococcales cyanobacterium RU_4_20]|nr:SLC13 family permease [Synechococcales cyanobacterium RU_4_20]
DCGVEQTGGMTWISQNLLGLPKGQLGALSRLLFPIVGMSAFLNNTPIVAMFVPVVSDWARKLRISPSKLMIPLSYGAIFGGICTLIGTSTNLVVNGLIISQAKLPGLGMFDMTPVSLPCAIAGCLYMLTLGHRLLPDRKAAISEQDDIRQYTVEMVVEPNSPLAGKTIEQAGLRHLPGLYLGKIIRGDQTITAVSPQERLREADQLVFMGMVDSIVDLKKMRGLQPATNQVLKLDAALTERCLIEAVVSNTSPIAGQTIREGQFRKRYNAVVLAAARNGERIQGKIGDICLQPGDSLLLEAHPSFLNLQRASRDFYLISGVPNSEPLQHSKAPLALAILIVMVVVVALGWVEMLLGAVVAAVLMVVTRCCAVERSLRGIDWSLLLVIAAALGIGKGLEVTGAAEAIAQAILAPANQNPWLALTLIYGATTILTEVITNNAAAALVFPVALSVSQSLGVSFMPFAIAIMVGASASFSTPIGYQTNLMVYGPGGYRFTDFMRVGIPLNLMFWVITVALTPLFFPF